MAFLKITLDIIKHQRSLWFEAGVQADLVCVYGVPRDAAEGMVLYFRHDIEQMRAAGIGRELTATMVLSMSGVLSPSQNHAVAQLH